MNASARTAADTGRTSVRQQERQLLFAGVDGLRAGGARILEIVGEPGIGKTTLITDLLDHARARGLAVLADRCTEFEQDIPFGAFMGVLGGAVTAEVLAELPPLAADILWRALSPVRPSGASIPADTSRYSFYRTARLLLEHLARDGLVLALDDLHWADERSVEFVDYLIRRPVQAPLLLVVAHRDRQASFRLRSTLAHGVTLGTIDRIELGPLSLAEAAQLTGLPARSQRLRELHRDSNGNPLYLLALARLGAAPEAPGALPVGDPVFDQYSGLVLGELVTHGAGEGRILDAAAVLGDRFDLPALAAVAGVGESAACAAVTNLVSRDLLRLAEGTPYYSFRHPFLRMLLYANLDPCWRMAAHRRAQALLAERGASAAEQAHHIECSLAGPSAEDLAVLTRAAREALQTDPRAAAHWLRLALRVLPPDRRGGGAQAADGNEIRLLLARALGISGQLAESRDLLHEILRAVPSGPSGRQGADQGRADQCGSERGGPGRPGLRVEALTLCALVECLLGRYEEARALLLAELELVGTDRPLDRVALIVEHGIIGVFDGRPTEADHIEYALDVARAHGERTLLVGALALAGLNAALRGDRAEALRTVSACASLVDGLPDADLARIPQHLAALAWTETYLGRTDASERHFNRSLALTDRAGQRHVRPLLLVGLSVTCYRVGRLTEAQRLAVEAKETAREIGAQHVRGLALALNSLCTSWIDPRASRAISLAERAVRILRGSTSWWSYIATISLANAATIAGDPQRCVTLLVTAGGGPDLPLVPPFLRSACQELLMTALENIHGRPSAPEWAGRVGEETADPTALACEHGYARTVQAHVVRAQLGPAAAAKLYENAAASFAAAGMIFLQAWALTLAGKCVAAERPDEATVLFQRARELARQCGATSMYEEADRQQRRLVRAAAPAGGAAKGGAAKGADRSPLALLTEREREIAGIAGTGKKTREIAEQLYLSPRTVDVHLTRIYRKLNVRSRAALARLMTEIG